MGNQSPKRSTPQERHRGKLDSLSGARLLVFGVSFVLSTVSVDQAVALAIRSPVGAEIVNKHNPLELAPFSCVTSLNAGSSAVSLVFSTDCKPEVRPVVLARLAVWLVSALAQELWHCKKARQKTCLALDKLNGKIQRNDVFRKEARQNADEFIGELKQVFGCSILPD